MTSNALQPKTKCRLCKCNLNDDEDDDFERQLCSSCCDRPEAARLGPPPKSNLIHMPGTQAPAREFTTAEKSLINKVHGYMSPDQLLELLNQRLLADLGPDASPYTKEMLFAAIGTAEPPKGGHDRASLRKLLMQARRSGLLATITEEMLTDFAIIFSLNQRQLLVLKDTITEARKEQP